MKRLGSVRAILALSGRDRGGGVGARLGGLGARLGGRGATTAFRGGLGVSFGRLR